MSWVVIESCIGCKHTDSWAIRWTVSTKDRTFDSGPHRVEKGCDDEALATSQLEKWIVAISSDTIVVQWFVNREKDLCGL